MTKMTLVLARNSAVIQSDHYLNSPLDLLLRLYSQSS